MGAKVEIDGNNSDEADLYSRELSEKENITLVHHFDAEEVIAGSIGTNACQEQVRTALALGADRAILVETELEVEPLGVAKLLKSVAEKEQPDLIILGKQAIDDDSNQTGQMLASLLSYPQGTFASEINIAEEKISVTREVDGGLQTVSLNLPAVVTTDLRLNEPRYASLPNIMKAKKKPLDTLTPEELGGDASPRTEILTVSPPPERAAGVIVESVDELVDKLKNEAKVIS